MPMPDTAQTSEERETKATRRTLAMQSRQVGPYTAPGVGWILAVLVAIFVILALIGVIVATEKVVLLFILALALAILL